MINPPAGPFEGPIPAGMEAPLPEQPLPINVPISEDEQKAVVTVCNSFKTSVRENARDKKEKMRDAYCYSKGILLKNDLLPLPSANGDENSVNKNRPKVFIPKTRQLVKMLYSYLKLTIFPNDEDFFRIRAKTEAGTQIEDQLTDGMKYILKEALITEKMGMFLLNLVSMSNAAVLPTIRDDIIFEWKINPMTMQYEAVKIDTPPMPDLEVLNPLHFYIDPDTKDPERAKWGYFGRKKKQEIKDSNLYFNKDDGRLERLSKKLVNDDNYEETRTKDYTDLNSHFQDVEDNVDYDLYYFPFLKTKMGEYRNILVGVVGQELVVRFHPNVFPRGMNPCVFTTWMEDPQSPYGIGPVEDVMELQKLINIIYNYIIELLSKIGNRFAVRPDVDLSGAFGVAASVFVADNPREDVSVLTGDYAEPAALMNFVGTLAAELQQVGGAQNPFQGSSNIDFKKTATEMQILQENSISVTREVIDHVSIGVQRVLERMMYLCADLYKTPIPIRVDDPIKGPSFVNIDFSVLRSGDFTVELININPSQSKQAQVETLTKLAELIGGNPMVLPLMQPVLQKIAQLEGLRDGPQMLQEIIMKLQGVIAPQVGVPPVGPEQQGVQGPQVGPGINPQPPVDGVPAPVA